MVPLTKEAKDKEKDSEYSESFRIIILLCKVIMLFVYLFCIHQ